MSKDKEAPKDLDRLWTQFLELSEQWISTVKAKDARIAKLREALEFYGKTVSGKIIEYYVNTGPLYEKYEVPLSDNGERARQALAESEDK